MQRNLFNYTFDAMKKWLSYLFPFTKKIQTNANGILEITWYNGKKILDSKHANYSYGSLQRILKFGLNQIDLSKVKALLLLGLGGGSVIDTLKHDFNYSHKITAVEIDEAVINIAKEEFKIEASAHLQIIHDDAYTYVCNSWEKYDLLIIDVFIDDKVPPQFFSVHFWLKVRELLNEGATVLFNASTDAEVGSNMNDFIEALTPYFYFKRFDKVEGSNTLLIGHVIKPTN